MLDFIELMTKPMAACLVLIGIHAYLGLHVVRRGVIFVDLALAQVSALGATMGFLFGFELHSIQGYFWALAFTLVGAGIFTFTRARKPAVPQEALIGVVYAVSAAAVILVLSRAPEGGEELKNMLVGHLLFVDWPEILTALALYTPIAALHWFARKPLGAISDQPGKAYEQNLHVRAWDFFFYATFGVVVTTAVQIVGVLLVFAFLIVPAICAIYLVKGARPRLFAAWTAGILASVIGLTTSFYADLPTGATVVCSFGLVLVLTSLLRPLIRRGA